MEGILLRYQLIPGGEADAPQDPEGILPETLAGIADGPQGPVPEILSAAVGVHQAPGGGVGHGVDGEVPALQIVLQPGHEGDPVRVTAVGISAFCPVSGDLADSLREDNTDGAVLFTAANQLPVAEDLADLFGLGGGAEVIILGGQTQQMVPDTAAYGIGFKAGFFQAADT